MPTWRSCAMVAPRAEVPRGARRLAALLVAVLLAGCAGGGGVGLQVRRGGPAVPPPTTAAMPLDEAMTVMTAAMLARAELDPPPPGRRHVLVVDPLMDRATGMASAATRRMEDRAATVLRNHPDYELRPFESATLEAKPLVLLGAITPVAAPGIVPGLVGGTPGAYRIWAVIADLRTNTVVAHETAWVRPETVDPTPTDFHADSPGWLPDPSALAYIRVCAMNPGDAVDPAYLRALPASVAVAEGARAYEGGRYREALAAFGAAAAVPGGDQMRVRNGLYLAHMALGQRREAEAAFGSLVDYGLANRSLSLKMVFQPGSTAFWRDPTVSRDYPMWLRQVAERTARGPSCLRLVGHSSPTGPATVNERLSRARAEVVRTRLVVRQPVLGGRTDADGRGAREPVVGTGRDDMSDVLDRRVEFLVRACPTPPLMAGPASRAGGGA